MGSTDAERARRHRAHRRGDHSLCNPDRCRPTAVTAPVTTAVTVVTPVTPTAPPATSGDATLRTPRLGVRGRWLWAELVGKGKPGPAERVLIEEACRLADRLDRLDAISNGKDRAWLQLSEELPDVEGQITVVVDKVLAEARQQQSTLKVLLAELRQAAAGAAPAAQGQGQGGSFRDQLAARRTARLADAAGS